MIVIFGFSGSSVVRTSVLSFLFLRRMILSLFSPNPSIQSSPRRILVCSTFMLMAKLCSWPSSLSASITKLACTISNSCSILHISSILLLIDGFLFDAHHVFVKMSKTTSSVSQHHKRGLKPLATTVF